MSTVMDHKDPRIDLNDVKKKNLDPLWIRISTPLSSSP
jgi:hypothetical protein